VVDAVREAVAGVHLRDHVAEVRRLLRSPAAVTAELVGVALAGVAATIVTQHPTAAERARLAARSPLMAAAVRALELDRVFTAGWFLAIVALAACSLAVVVYDGWRRAAREWRSPAEGWFRAAPYRRELTRAATGCSRRAVVVTRGRLGTLGSPLFHTGLLVVTLGGMARMLYGADAARPVIEEELLPASTPRAFETQDAGLLAAPVELAAPLRIVDLAPTWYPSGDLRTLSARVVAAPGGGAADRSIAVNAPFEVGDARVYLTQMLGPVAMLDMARDGVASPAAALLEEGDGGDYEWRGQLPGGLELRLRSPVAPRGPRPPDVLDVRVLRRGALLAAGRLQPGAQLAIPGGPTIAFRGVRWWVRLLASRDPTVWPVYVGFALALAGIAFMLVLIRSDALVVVEPLGAEERVVIALRPRRLAPLFAERFERLVERETRAT
jgi:cytochrome c biogenesis protein ResB